MPSGRSPLRGEGSPAPGPLIITVHGTNDALPDSRGGQWWQIESPFAGILERELAIRGWRNCEVSPYHWSGANSDADRLAAAAGLASRIRMHPKRGVHWRSSHIVTGGQHRHGGSRPRIGGAIRQRRRFVRHSLLPPPVEARSLAHSGLSDHLGIVNRADYGELHFSLMADRLWSTHRSGRCCSQLY